MQRYDKLVRDRIPEIIRAQGRACATERLDEGAYVASLKRKLVEEAQEAGRAPGAELVGELADLLEVIEALSAALGIEMAAVQARQREKRLERGGFDERVKLLWVREAGERAPGRANDGADGFPG